MTTVSADRNTPVEVTPAEQAKAQKEFEAAVAPLKNSGLPLDSLKSELTKYFEGSRSIKGQRTPREKDIQSLLADSFTTTKAQQDLAQLGGNINSLKSLFPPGTYSPSFEIHNMPMSERGNALMQNGVSTFSDSSRTIYHKNILRINPNVLDSFAVDMKDGKLEDPELKRINIIPSQVLENETGELQQRAGFYYQVASQMKDKGKLTSANFETAGLTANTLIGLPEYQLSTFAFNKVQSDQIKPELESGSLKGASQQKMNDLIDQKIEQKPTEKIVSELNQAVSKNNGYAYNYHFEATLAGENIILKAKDEFVDASAFTRSNPDMKEVLPGVLRSEKSGIVMPAESEKMMQTALREEMKEAFGSQADKIDISFATRTAQLEGGKTVTHRYPVFSERK